MEDLCLGLCIYIVFGLQQRCCVWLEYGLHLQGPGKYVLLITVTFIIVSIGKLSL